MQIKGKWEVYYFYKYLHVDKKLRWRWTGSGIFTMAEVKILKSVYRQWIKAYGYYYLYGVDSSENIPEIQFLLKAFKTSKKISKVFIDFDNQEYKIIEEI